MKTKPTKAKDIKRKWRLIDAKDKILGRLATELANLLMGKNKPYYVSYLDCGDYVVVVNASFIKLTGNKSLQKIYYRHSGYPGGFKKISFQEQMAKDPRKIIAHAVNGMLPKNKLKKKRLARLFIFSQKQHPYEKKFS